MRIHCLKNVETEDLGYIAIWAEEKGYTVTYTECYAESHYPALTSIDLLVIAGGPMGVNDEQEYPWLQQEKAFIQLAIKQNTKILGICLGAQLVAQCLGARVYANTQPEMGWFPVYQVNTSVHKNPLSSLPAQFEVLHWHGDTFDLPADAKLIASSKGCRNQAFIYNQRVVGIQFHVELTIQNVRNLILAHDPTPGTYVQPSTTILGNERRFYRLQQTMFQMMDGIDAL